MKKIIWFTLLLFYYRSGEKAMRNLTKTIIISDYSSSYESIHTEEVLSLFWLKVRYLRKGYRVWAFPTMWMASIWYKLFKKGIYKGTNISFEKHIPGSDQITYWQPWMNVY